MARVTATDVEEIMTDMADELPDDISAFITAGNLFVTDRLSDAGHAAALLVEIERWVVAHLVCCDVRRHKQITTGSSTETVVGQFGKALDLTEYGQTAKMLDSSGLLDDDGPGFMFETLP